MSKDKPSTLKKIAFSLIILILFIICAEVVLRIFYKDEKNTIFYNKNLGNWTLVPNTIRRYPNFTVKTNSLGLRSDELSQVKQAGEKRLIVLGDSSIFGHGVEYIDTFCQVLERLLNGRKNGITYRVINAGIPGHTTNRSLGILKDIISKVQPDFVLVVNMNSDCIISDMRDKETLPIKAGLRKALRYSRIYYMTERLTVDIRRKHFHRTSPGPSVIEPEYTANLKKFAALAKNYGARAVFIAPPNPMDIYSGDELQDHIFSNIDRLRMFRELQKGKTGTDVRMANLNHYRDLSQYIPRYRELMKKAASEEGAGYLNLGEAFTRHHAENKEAMLFIDEVHPGVTGHRLIGETLYRFLLEKGLIP